MSEDYGSDDASDAAPFGPSGKKWNHFIPHEKPTTGGKLWEYSRLGRRQGMSHPPRNPAVQQEILEYFEQNKIAHDVKRRPVKPRGGDTSQPESPSANQMTRSSCSLGSAPSKHGNSTEGRRSSSASNLKKSDPGLGWTLPWAPNQPLPRGDSTGSRRGTKGGGGGGTRDFRPAELWAQQTNPHVKARATPLPETFDDMESWGKTLRHKTRDLGIIIDAKPVEDCSGLAMYHNGVARSLKKHSTDRCELSSTMRSWSDTMRSTSDSLTAAFSRDVLEEEEEVPSCMLSRAAQKLQLHKKEEVEAMPDEEELPARELKLTSQKHPLRPLAAVQAKNFRKHNFPEDDDFQIGFRYARGRLR